MKDKEKVGTLPGTDHISLGKQPVKDTTYFSYYKPPIQNTIPYMDCRIQDVADLVRNALETETKTLRSLTSADAQKEYKATKLPYVTFSCTASQRGSQYVTGRSVWFSIDIDYPNDLLASRRHILSNIAPALLYTSPRGNGLKIVYQVDTEAGSHETFFRAFQNYFHDLFGLEIDKQCKDITRAAFLCHDPEAYYNPEPDILGAEFIELFAAPAEPQAPPRSTGSIVPPEHTAAVITKLTNWVSKEHSFTEGSRNEYITALAGALHRYGVSENATLGALLTYAEPGFTEAEIRASVGSIYSNPTWYATTDYRKLTGKESLTLEDYEQYRITDKTEIPYPVPILKINGDRVATPGAITTVSGQPKSGKTAFTGIVIAGAISSTGDIDGLTGIEVMPNIECKAVIHCDTEQDRYTHQYNHKTILKRAGLFTCPDNFLSYNIRQLNVSEYQDTLNGICTAAADKFDGIHSIYIDGAADFITSVNDEVQSFEIVDYFNKLAIKYNTAVFVIVHTNPGSEKERGHLGSQFQRKSTGVLAVKKEGDVSYLDTKLMRFTNEGTKIQFRYDRDKGYHTEKTGIVDLETEKAEARIEKTQKACEAVFGGQKSFAYSDAIDAIMRHTKKAESTAKSMFKDMKAHEMIKQGMDKNWRKQ